MVALCDKGYRTALDVNLSEKKPLHLFALKIDTQAILECGKVDGVQWEILRCHR